MNVRLQCFKANSFGYCCHSKLMTLWKILIKFGDVSKESDEKVISDIPNQPSWSKRRLKQLHYCLTHFWTSLIMFYNPPNMTILCTYYRKPVKKKVPKEYPGTRFLHLSFANVIQHSKFDIFWGYVLLAYTSENLKFYLQIFLQSLRNIFFVHSCFSTMGTWSNNICSIEWSRNVCLVLCSDL